MGTALMRMHDDDLKAALIAYLRKHHTEVCRQWFDDISFGGIDGGVLRLVVGEPVQLNYLQRACGTQFTDAAQAVTGRLLAVRFVGSSPELVHEPAPDAVTADMPGFGEQMLLSPDYSFDTFVVGPGNRLAHAAALAVAEKPGRAYNPFFIHGGVGLGKTHLLQAICQTFIRNRPSTKLCYISCSTFMDLFHESVKCGRMQDFRLRFRNVDVLVIDDIHFLSKRDHSQEEFFHTFNALHQAGKQIVLSSDAAPEDIPELEERLVSRFKSGLVACMERPCFETRVAIIKSKAKLVGIELPDEVPAYIAARIDSNIRELEGALTRVRGHAAASGIPITLESAKAALHDLGPGSGAPSLQAIIVAVTRYYDIKLADLMSRRRTKSIALPRQVCMWLARRHTRFSLEEIGGHFGGRDHTTVLHAIRTIEERRTSCQELGRAVDEIERSLGPRTTV